MPNNYFKLTFTVAQQNLESSNPLYRYLIIPIVMSEKIEDAMDTFINDNKSYLPNFYQNLNNELLPVLNNLGSNSLRYQKFNLCINILLKKFEIEQELHLQGFLEDLITIGYKQIYSAIINLPLTPNYFDEFYKYAQKFKLYDTEDEIFYFSNLLIYIGSKYKYFEVPFLKNIYLTLANISEDWFEVREKPTLKVAANNSLYNTLAVHNDSGIMDKNKSLNSVFISENCIHFFACLHECTYVEHTKTYLDKFKERIFANHGSIQARAFINYIFHFEKDIDLEPNEEQANLIDRFMYQEYVNFQLLNSDLEALLNNTVLTQQDLNKLYLQQIVKGTVYYANQPLSNSLNIRLKDYIEKDMNLIRVDILKNIISLCQTLQQQTLEAKYLKLLIKSTDKCQ